jgi:GntR family transcriptional repressor for pyruvate dehydrogenase complex
VEQNSRGGGGFGTPLTRAPRLSDRVADTILAVILEQGLRPGDQLPSERELGEQFGVSRTVVREAVRGLAARGVVEAQAGRGLAVAAVGLEDVATSMRLYLHGQDELPYEKVDEVRTLLEVSIAGLAAERGTEEQLQKLRATHAQMEQISDTDEYAQLDLEFHRRLARMTQNELHLIVLDSIRDVLLEIRRTAAKLPNDLQSALAEHGAILDAVANRDEEGARDAMTSHLRHASEDWKQLGPVKLHRSPSDETAER